MDVESFFDLTDLNTFLVLLLSLSLMGIVLDLYYRYTNGQQIEEDSTLYSFIYSYTLNLIVYFMAIWAIFFFHYITPYNAYSVLDLYFFNKNYSPSFLLALIVIILSVGTLCSLVSCFITIRIISSIMSSLLILILSYIGLILSIIFYSISSFRSKDQSSIDFNLINPSSSIVFSDKSASLAFD